jgi:hypothetical protein
MPELPNYVTGPKSGVHFSCDEEESIIPSILQNLALRTQR